MLNTAYNTSGNQGLYAVDAGIQSILGLCSCGADSKQRAFVDHFGWTYGQTLGTTRLEAELVAV